MNRGFAPEGGQQLYADFEVFGPKPITVSMYKGTDADHFAEWLLDQAENQLEELRECLGVRALREMEGARLTAASRHEREYHHGKTPYYPTTPRCTLIETTLSVRDRLLGAIVGKETDAKDGRNCPHEDDMEGYAQRFPNQFEHLNIPPSMRIDGVFTSLLLKKKEAKQVRDEMFRFLFQHVRAHKIDYLWLQVHNDDEREKAIVDEFGFMLVEDRQPLVPDTYWYAYPHYWNWRWTR